MLRRNWRMPPGLFRAVRRHKQDMLTSWHPAGRWIEVSGDGPGTPPVRLHVVSQGQGPDVLLLHGYVQSSWCWRHNLAALAEQFTVHAVCALGFGWSDKPRHVSYRVAARALRTLEVMDRLAIERAHLVGNSLGGRGFIRQAATAAQRVGKVVLVNPAVAGRYPMALVARAMHPRWRRAFAAPGLDAGFWLGLRAAAYHGADVDEEYMRRFLGPLAEPGAIEAALAVARFYNQDMASNRRRLEQVQAPALTIVGKHDRIVPPRVTERFGQRLPGRLVSVFEHSAHCPHEEQPERFNAEIAGFLRGD